MKYVLRIGEHPQRTGSSPHFFFFCSYPASPFAFSTSQRPASRPRFVPFSLRHVHSLPIQWPELKEKKENVTMPGGRNVILCRMVRVGSRRFGFCGSHSVQHTLPRHALRLVRIPRRGASTQVLRFALHPSLLTPRVEEKRKTKNIPAEPPTARTDVCCSAFLPAHLCRSFASSRRGQTARTPHTPKRLSVLLPHPCARTYRQRPLLTTKRRNSSDASSLPLP